MATGWNGDAMHGQPERESARTNDRIAIKNPITAQPSPRQFRAAAIVRPAHLSMAVAPSTCDEQPSLPRPESAHQVNDEADEQNQAESTATERGTSDIEAAAAE